MSGTSWGTCRSTLARRFIWNHCGVIREATRQAQLLYTVLLYCTVLQTAVHALSILLCYQYLFSFKSILHTISYFRILNTVWWYSILLILILHEGKGVFNSLFRSTQSPKQITLLYTVQYSTCDRPGSNPRAIIKKLWAVCVCVC